MEQTTTSKHDPGPWVAYVGRMGMDEGLNPFFKGIVALLKRSGEDDEVAVILDRDEPAYSYEANARLIAAAPDLLAAAELALRYIEEHCHEVLPEGRQGKRPPEELRAAIARVTGAQS